MAFTTDRSNNMHQLQELLSTSLLCKCMIISYSGINSSPAIRESNIVVQFIAMGSLRTVSLLFLVMAREVTTDSIIEQGKYTSKDIYLNDL